MKKSILATAVLLIGCSAFANGTGNTGSVSQPTQEAIEAKALVILLSKMESVKAVGQIDQPGRPLASVLAPELVTSGDTNNKIRNKCSLDKKSSIFTCRLVINNRDDSGETESASEFIYQLKKDPSGLPSELLPKVQVNRFG